MIQNSLGELYSLVRVFSVYYLVLKSRAHLFKTNDVS